MGNKRLEYIDVAKGMLIVLMVFGHTLNVAKYQPEVNDFVRNANLLETLYKGFYMCTFFVITGYCSNFNKPFFDFTKANLKTIVLPAFSLFFIIQAINLSYARDFQIMDYLNFNFRFFFINGLCAWFLASLFIARNVYWVVIRFLKSERYRFLLFVALYVLGYVLSHHTRNIWSYQQAFMFLLFLEYGQHLKTRWGGGEIFTGISSDFSVDIYSGLYIYRLCLR